MSVNSDSSVSKPKLAIDFVLKRTFSILFGHLLVFWGLCIVARSLRRINKQ